MTRNYDIGYGKPPKASQFKPGKSGNPKGRPRSSRNLKTDLEEELFEVMAVTERGRKRHLSKRASSSRPGWQKHCKATTAHLPSSSISCCASLIPLHRRSKQMY